VLGIPRIPPQDGGPVRGGKEGIRATVEEGTQHRGVVRPDLKEAHVLDRVDTHVGECGREEIEELIPGVLREDRDLLATQVADARDAGPDPHLLAAGVQAREHSERCATIDRRDQLLRMNGAEVDGSRGRPVPGATRRLHVLDVGEALFEQEFLRKPQRRIAGEWCPDPDGRRLRWRQSCRASQGTVLLPAGREQSSARKHGAGTERDAQQLTSRDGLAVPAKGTSPA